jgi:hypothetical protein
MSWQEELQQLDSELAQGRVTPEDYRQRRDQLLGLAQQAGAPGPGAPTGPPSQPVPAQPEQAAPSPFGAPFRWQPSNPGAEPAAESTTIMPPITDLPQAGDHAERTQVVRGGTAGVQPQQGPENAERTQVVRNPQQPNFPPPNYQGGFGVQQQSQGNWNQPAPWDNDNDMPLPNPSSLNWMRQGPEVFEEHKRSRGKIIGIVAVVVVLLAAGFGAYMIWGRSGPSTPTAGGSTTTVAPTTTTKPSDPLLADIAGTSLISEDHKVTDFTAVQGLNYLTSGPKDSEVAAYEAGNPSTVRFALSKNGGDTLIVLVVKEGSADAAKQAKTQLVTLQTGYGQKTETAPAGVSATGLDTIPGASPVLRRAHYTSGAYVVRIEVSGTSVSSVEKDFTNTITAQTTKLKPDA